MKLVFHEGKNFGDALNPIIFRHYLNELIDDKDESRVLLGIGSILGLKQHFPKDCKKIVFSSGYAAGMNDTYGSVPNIDESYDVICVRGPKTAEILGVDKDLAIADGAILLYDIVENKNRTKQHKYTFIPHSGSEKKFNYKKIVTSLGINYLSPTEEPDVVIDTILSSECIITEAMHGAIAADALRVPWKAIKLYPTINEFKWEDYCLSMNLKYKPFRIKGIYNDEMISKIASGKLRSGFLAKTAVYCYKIFRSIYLEGNIRSALKKVMNDPETSCSEDKLMIERVNQLKEKLELLRNKYSQ